MINMSTESLTTIAKEVPELSYSVSWTAQAIDYRNGPKTDTEVTLCQKVVGELCFIGLTVASLIELLARVFFALLLLPVLVVRSIDREAYKMILCGALLSAANVAICAAACVYNCVQEKLDYDALLPSAQSSAFLLLKNLGVSL